MSMCKEEKEGMSIQERRVLLAFIKLCGESLDRAYMTPQQQEAWGKLKELAENG